MATGSTAYSSGYNASKAFDGISSTYWHNSGISFPQWIKYDFGSGVAWNIGRIKITSSNDGNWEGWPKDFVIAGSNNDSDWTTIETVTGASFTQNSTRTFDFPNSGAYRYIRITVNSTGRSGWLTIQEIEMFEILTKEWTDEEGYNYISFISTPVGGKWAVPKGVKKVDVFLIGGGSAGSDGVGGTNYGSGGAGGQHKLEEKFSVSGEVDLSVGVGGKPNGNAGTSSVFSTITATGGKAVSTGRTGGHNDDYSGGTGSGGANSGGGAGTNGNASTGNGGAAVNVSSIFGTGIGVDGQFGGGGRGANSGGWGTSGVGVGIDNTGSGGNGGAAPTPGGKGTGGIVVIRYKIALTGGKFILAMLAG